MSGLEKIAAKCAALGKRIFKAFFEIKDEESVADGSKKVAITMARRAFYVFLDYWAVFACASVVGILKFWGWSFWSIVGATWLFDFVVAAAFMVASEKSGHDITLGEGFRRANDVIHSESKLFGILTMIGLNLKATIWDGPEQVVIFFKKELGGMIQMAGALVGLTLVQGFFWAWVYSLGYESVTELVKSFF